MKKLRIFLVMLILSAILSGCNNQGSEVINNGSKQNNNTSNPGSSTKEMVNVTGNEKIFVQNNANGSELWFDKWHFHNDSTDEDFIINGKKYDSGLGYDGNTVEGPDKRGFAFVEYRIVSGKYDEITGIFGFDDKTKIKPNSKLSILVNNSVIYESDPINETKASIEIKVPVSKDAKTIGFKFETEIKSDIIPKIVFADIKMQKVE